MLERTAWCALASSGRTEPQGARHGLAHAAGGGSCCGLHRAQETAEAAAQAFGVPKAYWSVADLAADPDIEIIDVGGQPPSATTWS